jgi:hypothetical protein
MTASPRRYAKSDADDFGYSASQSYLDSLDSLPPLSPATSLFPCPAPEELTGLASKELSLACVVDEGRLAPGEVDGVWVIVGYPN